MSTSDRAKGLKHTQKGATVTAAAAGAGDNQQNINANNDVSTTKYYESTNTKHESEDEGTKHDEQQQSQQSSLNHEYYERAILRALTENEHVRSVNTQLLTKLNTMTHENEASRENIQRMKCVCESMKELVGDLVDAKDVSESKAEELERTYRKVHEAEEERKKKLDQLKVGQKAIDGMVNEMRNELEVARRERDEARELAGERLLLLEKQQVKVKEVNMVSTLSKKSKEEDDWEGKYNRSIKELRKVTSDRDNFKSRVNELLTAKDAMEEHNNTLQYKVVELNAAKESEVVAVGNLQKELESVRSSLCGTSRKNDEAMAENASLRQQIESLQNETAQISASKDTEITNLQNELDSHKKHLHDAKANTQKLTTDLQVCQSRLDATVTSIASLDAQLTAAHAEKEHVQRSLSVQLDQASKEKSEVSRRMSSNIISLGEELLEYKQKVGRLDSSNNSQSSQSQSDHEKEQQQLNAKISSLEADLLICKQNEMKHANAVKLLESNHVEALMRVEGEKHAAIQNLEKKMDVIVENSMGAMDVQLKRTLSEKNDLAKKSVDLTVALAGATNKCSALDADLLECKRYGAAKASELIELKEELASVRTSLIDTTSEMGEVLSSKEAIEKEILVVTSDRDELSSIKDSLQQETQSLKKEVTTISDAKAIEVGNLQKELDSAIIAKEELSSRNDTMEDKIRVLESDMAKIAIANEAEVDSIRKDLERVQSSLVDITVTRDELSAERDSMQQEISTLQTLTSEKAAASEAELKNLHQTLDSVQKQLDDANGNVKMLTNDLGTHKRRLEDANKSIKELSERVNAAQTEREELRQDMTGRLREVTMQKESISDSMNKLMRELAMVNDDGPPSMKLRAARAISSDEKMEGGGGETETTRSIQNKVQENISVVGKLKSNLRSLQNQKADLLKTIKGKTATIDDLERQKENLDRQVERLTTEVKHSDELRSRQDDAEKVAVRERERLTIKIASLDADLLECKQNEERLTTDRISLESSHAEALAHMESEKNAAVQDLEKKVNNIVEKSGVIDKQLASTTSQKEELAEEVAALSVALASAKDQCLSLTKQLEDDKMIHDRDRESMSLKLGAKAVIETGLQVKQEELNSSMATLVKEREELSIQLDDSRQAWGDLHEELEKEKKSLIDTTLQRDKLLAELNESRKSHILTQDKLDSLTVTLTNDNKNFEERVQALETNKQELVAEEKERCEQIKQLIEQVDETELRLENAAKLAAQDRERLNIKIASLNADLLECKQNEERLATDMKSLDSSHAEVLAHMESEKNAAIQDFEKRVDNIVEKSDVMEEQLMRTTSQKEELAKEVATLSVALAGAKDQCLALTKQLEDDKMSLVKDREDMRLQLIAKEVIETELQAKQEELNSSVSALVKEQVELSIQLDESRQTEENLQKELEKEKKSLIDTTSQKVELLAELNESRKSHISVQDKLNSLTETWTTDKRCFEERVQVLETNKQELVAEGKEHCEQIKQLIEQVDETELGLEKSEAACRHLENEKEEQHEKMLQLNSQIAVSTSSILDLEKSLAEREAQIETLSKKLADMEDEKNAAMTKIERLSEELKSTATTLQDVQVLISTDQKQATEMKNRIKEIEVEKKMLEESILSVKRDRDSVESKLEFSMQEAEDFRCELKSSEALAESVTTQCEKLSRDIGIVESKLELSEQEVNDLTDKLKYFENLAEQMTDQCGLLARDKDSAEVKLELSRHEANDLSDKLATSEASAGSLTKKCEEQMNNISMLGAKLNAAEALAKELCLANQRDISRCKRQEETSQSEISCLENIISSLKKEYDAFKIEARASFVAQMRSCEAKLEPLCLTDGNENLQQQDQTFDDMIMIIRKEQSNLLKRAKSTAKKLEAAEVERSCLENIVSSLKTEYAAFKEEARAETAAQMRSCEAKLELCLENDIAHPQQQDQTFDVMIATIQIERSNLAENATLLSKELEAAQDENFITQQQVLILSKEVSKYKLQNKGMLQALDEITNTNRDVRDEGVPIDEVAVDREVEKRLTSFRHKMETQANNPSVGMSVEMSLSH